MARLRDWCKDATAAGAADGGAVHHFVYVNQEGFDRNPPKTFAALAAGFTEYQEK